MENFDISILNNSVKYKGNVELFTLLVMNVPDKNTNCELSFKKTERNIVSASIMKKELQIDLLKSLLLKCFFEFYWQLGKHMQELYF